MVSVWKHCRRLSCFVLISLCLVSLAGMGNAGGAATPPMGWRSWNVFEGAITQDIMEAQMAALADRSRLVAGFAADGTAAPASLADVGYVRAGLDDAWQACGAGVRGPGAHAGSFHDENGHPLVNKTRFPDMKGMVGYGHRLGLKVGWYINNCICGEGAARLPPEQVHRDVVGNAAFVTATGFDGVKADGCGAGRNMTLLASLLNANEWDVLIENCHYNKVMSPSEPQPHDNKGRIFPYWKDNITGGTLVCPEDTFRASGDIRNSWSSWFGNLNSLTPYQDVTHPISQPGCWAYPDMLMVGVFASKYAPDAGAAASPTEWRSHFGAWCIVSSPLVLSFDLTNASTLSAVWPFVTNVEAIGVNQAWAGHPGRRLNVTYLGAVQVWAKPLLHEAHAVLLVNSDGRDASGPLRLRVADIAPSLPAAAHVRDVWAHADAPQAVGGVVTLPQLAPHDSAFLILKP